MKKKKTEKDIFDNIIGYDDIKKTIRRIVDVLNNTEKYNKLGCNIPHGLILYGKPGTGKTTISNAILDNITNRKKIIIRKTKSDGSFIDYIESQFNLAIKEQPSILLLDDLDKFAENDEGKCNQEEYVAIQSQIDRVKNENVFVIATVNDKDVLPDSLVRSGRFDIQIVVKDPSEEDAIKIFEYYLSKKKISKDVDAKKIAQILIGSSCADLEKVCNQAALYSGFENKKEIGMKELIKASLECRYGTNLEDFTKEDDYTLEVAYHEAGHALIAHLLEPGSVSFITVAKSEGSVQGMTIYHDNNHFYSDVKYFNNRIKSLLASKATTDIVYNKCDVGTSSDIRNAYKFAEQLITKFCMDGYDAYEDYYHHSSDKTKYKGEEKISKLLSDYYSEVKNMISSNRLALDSLATELADRKILFGDEIGIIIDNFLYFGNSKKALK